MALNLNAITQAGQGVPQPEGPTEQFAKQMQLRNMVSQQQTQELQRQLTQEQIRNEQFKTKQLERAQEGDRIFGEIVAKHETVDPDTEKHTIDHEGIIADLNKAGYHSLAVEYAKNAQDYAEHRQTLIEKELKNRAESDKQVGAIMGSFLTIEDPQQKAQIYPSIRQRAAAIDPTVANTWPEQYQGPQTDAAIQAEADGRSQDPFGQALKRFQTANTKKEGDVKDADLKKKQYEAAAQSLSTARSQAAWTQALAGLPASIRAEYPTTYSEESRQDALMKGVTPDKLFEYANKVKTKDELIAMAAKGDLEAQKVLDYMDKRDLSLDYLKKKAQLRAESEDPEANSDTTSPGLTGGALPKDSPYASEITAVSQKYNVPVNLLHALMQVESSGKSDAVSNKGALGLMQIMPANAVKYGYKPEDMKDPAKNLDVSAQMLAESLKRLDGNVDAVLSEYNSGGANNYKTNPEVAKYVEDVKGLMGAPGKEPVKTSSIDVGEAAQGKRNEDFLKTVSPTRASKIKAIAEGREALPSGLGFTKPYTAALLDDVLRYDPSFDASNAPARVKTRIDFTSGKSAQNINNIATAIKHAENFDKSAKDLDNFSGLGIFNRGANEIRNWYKTQSGDTAALNKFKTDAGHLAEEATRVYRQAGGSEADIKRNMEVMNAADTYEGVHAAIVELVNLMAGKLDALKDQYLAGMSTQDFDTHLGKQTDTVRNMAVAKAAMARLQGLSDKKEETAPPKKTGIQVGQHVTVKGQKKVVTKVYDDGTFDGDPE